ncbi:MAG: hypothetical protein ACPGQL_08490 [Thermoplasmatota archaeon]
MKPKGLTLLLAVAFAATALAGCTTSDDGAGGDNADELPPEGSGFGGGQQSQDAASGGGQSSGIRPADDDEGPGTWYYYPGVQCEETPWETHAAGSGEQFKQESTADEPFEQSPQHEAMLKSYLESEGKPPRYVVAYFDDMSRASVCGNGDGWHYYVNYVEALAPSSAWTEAPDGPAHDYQANDESS